MIPETVARAIEAETGAVRASRPVGGGCVANASRIETARGVFFLKWAAGAAGSGFDGEAAGLRALAAAAPPAIAVPEPLGAAASVGGAPGFLLTDWIEPASAGPADWARFGEALAGLHRAPPPAGPAGAPYGFGAVTHCGPTAQDNRWAPGWADFFAERRLLSIAARLRTAGRWRAAWDTPLDKVLARIGDLLPARPAPALVHGDLWAGNAYATMGGVTALVDPAAYVGDREVDLAMMQLFGGFPGVALEAYEAAWPREPGHAERRPVYDLYHLMNHLLLFGDGYAPAVDVGLAAAAR